jgi:hypothetical protein
MTETWPTPIVRDFETFTAGIDDPSVYLSQAKKALNRQTLHALDQKMETFVPNLRKTG